MSVRAVRLDFDWFTNMWAASYHWIWMQLSTECDRDLICSSVCIFSIFHEILY